MAYQFRHSICNEVYEKRPFADVCKSIKRAGYTGIEIAPFTLAEDATTISAEARKEYRSIMQSEGLEFVGLHWLLVGPNWVHVSTPDAALRERSWWYVRGLVDLCAELGPNGIMVFGSPKQRSTTGGISVAEATKYFIAGLAALAPHAEACGVTILIEALPKAQCDVVTSLEEAMRHVAAINSPAIRSMFDVHNAVDEVEPHATLVDRYFHNIRHVHVNEMDGRHPGTGDYNFKPVLKVLRDRNYRGWISLEVFDFSAGADKIAQDSLRYLEREIKKLGP